MKIAITGGTGSIGREFAKLIWGHEITIISRGEADQVTMKQEYPEFNYVVCDIRDYSATQKAIQGSDYCFHFAALKHIDICQKQPQEAIKTNIVGTMNVINACQRNHTKLVSMSSDKAINPASVYGMTKKLAEDMVTEAGMLSIRSGNVLWSSGSVFTIWLKAIILKNEICLTSDQMTRFFIRADELARFIWQSRDEKGILTIPMQSFRMIDIANKFIEVYGNPETKLTITGLRAGERLHEYRDENTSSEENISNDLNYIFNKPKTMTTTILTIESGYNTWYVDFTPKNEFPC